MRLAEFDYELPVELIAQEALSDRAASRLLVVDRHAPAAGLDAHFSELPDFLDENDVIVVNRSRVVPARLFLKRKTGGRVEALFVRTCDDGTFEAWLRPLRRLKPGERLVAEDGETEFSFVATTGERGGKLRLEGDGTLEGVLEGLGHVPLPPYIRRDDRPADRERYQTVFARESGSVAAPTAGLHFNDAVLHGLEEKGVQVVSIVLHVGPGTFAPLDGRSVEGNTLHAETLQIDAAAIAAISGARAKKKRIVAVGTTVTRALEAAAANGWLEGEPRDHSAETNLFIYPGYTFSVVDRLLTNFHLPQSSLLLLVCAFGGTDPVLASYRAAVDRRYRFYSYGDAMFIR